MDFEFTRGDTKKIKFNLKDNNGEELSLSLTDKLFFTVKKNTKSDTVIIQKTLNNGIEHLSDNYYHITLSSNDTAELPYGTYVYDIELKTANGVVKTLILGTITLTDEVTWKGDES